MGHLATASSVLLILMVAAYVHAFLIRRRHFFIWMALSWIVNLIYLAVEYVSSVNGDLGVDSEFLVFISSMSATLCQLLALFDLEKDQRVFDRRIWLLWLPVIGASSAFAFSDLGMEHYRSFVLFVPCVLFSMMVLLSLAWWFKVNSPEATMELLRPVDFDGRFAPGVIKERQESNALPSLQFARRMLYLSFAGYGMIQPTYLLKMIGEYEGWVFCFFWIAFCCKLINGLGTQGLVLALVRDANHQLAEQSFEQELGVLTASIEHDIRNPMGLAFTQIDTTRRRFQHERPVLKFLEKFERYLLRIKGAVDVIPAMREGEEYYRKRYTPANLLKLIDVAVTDCKSEYQPGMVQVKVSSNRKVVVILAYRERIVQAFVNIIRNGIEATQELGGASVVKMELECNVDSENSSARVIFRDFGIGIRKEDKGKLLQALFTTKDESKNPNRGIGLFISNRIVQQHEGHLDIDSKHNDREGNVTEVIVTLSLAKHQKK